MANKSQSVILGLITIICWGSIATFGNLLIHLPPFYVLGISFLCGSIPALFRPRELFPNLKVFMWGVAGYFGYHFFLFYSFRFAPAVEANLINYMWPVLLVILSPVFFRDQTLRWYHIFGSALAVVGCVFLVLGKGGEFKAEYAQGYLLAALAAVSWPVYSLGKKLLPVVPLGAIGGFCLGAGILSMVTHFALEPRVVLQWQDAWKLFLMGLGPFGIAFYTWDVAISKGDTKIVGALAYLTPVLSTSGLILFAGQEMSKSTTIAMFLIIGGASTGLLDFLPSKLLKKA